MNWKRARLKVLRSALVLGCAAAVASPTLAQTPAAASDWGTYAGAAVGDPDFGNLGLKVFFGQQLQRYFGWEAGLTRFLRDVDATPFGDVKTDFWGVSGSAVGILPVTGEFSAFGKLGLMAGRKRIRGGAGGDRTENELNPLIGIGARYQLTPRAALRAEYEAFGQGDLISIGASYRF